MRRRACGLFAMATASSCLALLAAQGCNAILGNQEATLADANTPTPDGKTPAGDVRPKDASGDTTTDAGDAPLPCPSPDASLANDPHNCNRCGHDCLGGTCVAGVCQRVTVFENLPGPIQVLATDGTDLYWAGSGDALYFGPVSGGSSSKVATPALLGYGTVIAVDDATVYWAANGGVFSCAKPLGPSSSPTNLASMPLTAGLALDSTHLYFAVDGLDSGVFACSKASACEGGPTLLAAVDYPASVAAAEGHVLWTASGSLYDDVDGAVSKLVAEGGVNFPVASAGRIYWSETFSLWTCAVGACDASQAFAFDAGLTALTGDPRAAYFTDSRGDLLGYSLDAGPVELAADGGTLLRGIAVDAVAVYWSAFDFPSESASIFKVARP